MNKEAEKLCKVIEKRVGHSMESPQDFVWLSEQIWQTTHEKVSVNTLKRLWKIQGYEVTVPRRTTLDVLAWFAGYKDFVTFCMDKEENSKIILTRHVQTKDLETGIKVHLTGLPDRKCVFTHLGKGRFVISEVENSRLSVGDTFECSFIIEGEPLYLNNLIHKGKNNSLYVIGNVSGIHFEVTEE